MNQRLTVAFRVDASTEIGSGHVMRCLTLAEGLRKRGADCRFLARAHDGHLMDRINAAGFAVSELQRGPTRSEYSIKQDASYSDWLGVAWQDDAQQTCAAIENSRPGWLVVDHYALDARWHKAVRPYADRIMVIDDLADRLHDCDLLLDQNLIANFASRYSGRVPEHCGLLLGPHYALLQPQYAAAREQVRPRVGPVKHLLCFFGGADTNNLSEMALDSFLSLQTTDIALTLVVASTHLRFGALEAKAAAHANVTLCHDLPSLAPLMLEADLAIGGSGTTTWERCCLGLPSLVVTLAENQTPIARELDTRGVVRWIGDASNITSNQITDALKDVFEAGLSQDWSDRCSVLVDGNGLDRVTEFVMLSRDTHLRARPALPDDEQLLLDWANDAATRKNAFSTDPIAPETHHRWLAARLADSRNCRLFIIETQSGLPVGQVRFQRERAAFELHYSLDARARGRRLANPLLRTAISAFRADFDGPASLIAQIKRENSSSARALESVGFRIQSDEGDGRVYKLSLPD